MKILFITLIIALSLNAQSNQSYGSVLVSEVTRIYDARTFRVNIKDFPDILGDNILIRVNQIDTPDINSTCKQEKGLARQAKEYAVVSLRTAKKIELRNIKRGKYFRIIADVYINEKSLADNLVKHNLAVAQNSDTKLKDWCEEKIKEKPTEALAVRVIPNSQKYLIDNKEIIEKVILEQIKVLAKSADFDHTVQGENKIEFTINRNLSTRWVTLKKPSDKEILNEISLEAIERSSTHFPAPPRGTLVQVEFTYDIK